MRYIVSGAALLGAVGMVLAAGWMNWRYMSSLATDPHDRLALGVASVGIDVMKAALAYLIALAWDKRQWGYVGLASASYLLLGLVSFASSLGFATDRGDTVVIGRDSLAARYAGSTKELAEIETKLKTYEGVQASAVVESEIAGLKGSPRWPATKSCSVMKGGGNVAFCASLADKRVALARAKAAESLETRRAELRSVIAELVAKGGKREERSQVAASLDLREGGLRNTLLALVLELGAGLGVYLALRPVTGNGRKAAKERPRDDESRMPLVRVEAPAPSAGEATEEPNATAGENRSPPNGKAWRPTGKRRRPGKRDPSAARDGV